MRRSKKTEEDEIPKSVLKMKQEKAKREEAEKKNNRKKNKRSKKEANVNSQEKPKKKIIKKIILILFLIALVALGIVMAISAFSWKNITSIRYSYGYICIFMEKYN